MEINDKIYDLIVENAHFRINPISLDNMVEIIDLIEENEFKTSRTSNGNSIILELLIRNEPELAFKVKEKTEKIMIDDAAACGDLEIVTQLLNIDPRLIEYESEFEGFKPIHLATGFSNSFETVEYLISKGADLDNISTGERLGSMSPLISCIIGGNPEILELILKSGVNTNLKDGSSGLTPFELAKKNNRYDLAELISNYSSG